MDSRLTELTQIVEHARRLGARGSEVLYERSEGLFLASFRGRISDERPLHEATLTVRCWLDEGRLGEARGAPEDPVALVEQALERAAVAERDHYGGPEDRLEPPLGGLGIDDRRHAGLERDDKAELLVTVQRSVRKIDRRFSARDFAWEDRRRQRTFANSRGVTLEEYDTTYTMRGAVIGSAAGEDIRVNHAVEARSFATVAAAPLGHLVVQRAGAVVQRGEEIDGDVLVMMPPLVVARLFARIAEGFVHPEREFFLSPRGGVVLDDRVHLFDDGTLHGGLRSASFDDRGCSPVPRTLIRAGRPDGRYIDLRTGRAQGSLPTGHWWGDGLQPSNLLLRPGSRSMNAIAIDRATWMFWLDDLPDSAIDLATGQVDAVVSGMVSRGNEPRGGMRNVRLQGDLAQVLGAIDEIASDTDRHGHVDAPGMLVRGFRITRGRSGRSARG